MSKQVYCKECKFFKPMFSDGNNGSFWDCSHESVYKIILEPLDITKTHIVHFYEKNKKNDCKDFKKIGMLQKFFRFFLGYPIKVMPPKPEDITPPTQKKRTKDNED